MSTPQKAFQAEMFAKNHYRKLLTAKSSVKQLKNRGNSTAITLSKTITPLDRYQYHTTNNKICSKLTEIYKAPQTSFRKYRRSKDNYSKSLNQQTLVQEHENIKKDNEAIFERILCAKSIVNQNWNAREKQLKKYNKLARKKVVQTDQILFHAYRELMTQSRYKSTRSSRSKSSRRPSSSSKSALSKQVQQTL